MTDDDTTPEMLPASAEVMDAHHQAVVAAEDAYDLASHRNAVLLPVMGMFGFEFAGQAIDWLDRNADDHVLEPGRLVDIFPAGSDLSVRDRVVEAFGCVAAPLTERQLVGRVNADGFDQLGEDVVLAVLVGLAVEGLVQSTTRAWYCTAVSACPVCDEGRDYVTWDSGHDTGCVLA